MLAIPPIDGVLVPPRVGDPGAGVIVDMGVGVVSGVGVTNAFGFTSGAVPAGPASPALTALRGSFMTKRTPFPPTPMPGGPAAGGIAENDEDPWPLHPAINARAATAQYRWLFTARERSWGARSSPPET
jgi:hypothetical protein